MTWHIYVIKTIDNYYYTGISTDPLRRFKEHCSSTARTARFLRAHRPLLIVFCQEVGAKSLALKAEYHFKQLSRPQKESIIKNQRLVLDAESGKIIKGDA